MNEWIYDQATQQRQALSAAGYEEWQVLGDINKFGWAKKGSEWSEWITRFNSPEQALSYAYQMVIKSGREIS